MKRSVELDAGHSGVCAAHRSAGRDRLGFSVLRTPRLGNALFDARLCRQAGPGHHQRRCELSETGGGSALGL